MSEYRDIDMNLPVKEWFAEHRRITEEKISEQKAEFERTYVGVSKDIKAYEDRKASEVPTSIPPGIEHSMMSYRKRKHAAVSVSGDYAVGSLVPKPTSISDERKKANREWVAKVRSERDAKQS